MAIATNKTVRDFVLLGAGLLFLLSWMLGSRGLNDPDEGRNSNIALNYLKPGADHWEPRMSGYAHYDKPPLIYWATALSFKVFGENETAARLPSLFGAVLALVGIGWAGARLYGGDVAWWTILICGTFGQFWVAARFLTLDMMLTGWICLGIGAWAESRARNGDWRFWFLSLFFWTLAWWTKAIAALIPLLAITIALLIIKDEAGKRSLKPLYLLLGIIVLGSAWYVRMIQQHGELVDFFFIREMKGRVTGHVEGRTKPVYFYFLLSFAAWLPWWPMAVRAIVGRCKSKWPTQREMMMALGVEGWTAIIGIVLFSSISSKLPLYTLPLAPFAALLFARCIVKAKRLLSARGFRIWAITSATVLPVIFVLGTPFIPKHESSFRLNSSLRKVSAILHAKKADATYLDAYWPSMEFYFGNQTFYVLRNDFLFKAKFQQRSDDSGLDPLIGEPHFYFPSTWLESVARRERKNIWLVHYDKEGNSPFLKMTNGVETIREGHFLLIHMDPHVITAQPPAQKF